MIILDKFVELAYFSSPSFLLTVQQKGCDPSLWLWAQSKAQLCAPFSFPSTSLFSSSIPPAWCKWSGNSLHFLRFGSENQGGWGTWEQPEQRVWDGVVWIDVCFHNLSARHPAPVQRQHFQAFHCFPVSRKCFSWLSFSCCNLRQAAFLQRNNKLLPPLLQ